MLSLFRSVHVSALCVSVVCGAQTLRAARCEGGSSDWKRAKKCWRLEGNDSVSGFFLINLYAALENCHRESEVLVKEQDTSAVPFYTPLRDGGCLPPFIPLELQTKKSFLTDSGRWWLSGLLLAVKLNGSVQSWNGCTGSLGCFVDVLKGLSTAVVMSRFICVTVL